MKKKDKVTLKGVDKPEVFQHWTGGIDPYHIEPIDNPQKLERRFVDPVDPSIASEINGFLNIDIEHKGEDIENCRGLFMHREMTGGQIIAEYFRRDRSHEFNKELLNQLTHYKPTQIVKERTPEDVMMELKAIKQFYPEVLEQFIKEHYGKKDS